MSEQFYPPLFHAADRSATDCQRQYVNLTRLHLTLLVSAAALAIAVSLAGHPIVLWLLALVFLAAFGLRFYLQQQRPERSWFANRAIAESVKTATWRFAMNAEPFQVPDGTLREDNFAARLRQLLTDARAIDFTAIPSGAPTITQEMRSVSSLPWKDRRDYYFAHRLDDQRSWYGTKANTNRRLSNQFAASVLALDLVALLAIAALAAGLPINAIGLLTSGGAALTAWTQLRRHDELTSSYGLAAAELVSARAALEACDNESTFLQRIDDTEESVSREHTMWAIKRGIA